MPRRYDRELIAAVPQRAPGPAAYGKPIKRPGLLDQPDLGNLGRSETFALTAANILNGRTILNLGGPDEEARDLSIWVSAELLNPAPANFINDALARLQWGSGGVQETADVDLGLGTVIQLTCSSLRVSALASGSGNLKANASVGYGQSGHVSPAQRTLKSAAAPAIAALEDFTMPRFACDLVVMRTPSTADFVIQFRRFDGTALGDIAIAPGDRMEAVRIPGGTQVVRITNGGVAMTALSLIFGLWL